MTIREKSETIYKLVDGMEHTSDFRNGNFFFRSRDYHSAARAYSKSIEKYSTFLPAWRNYIICLIQLKAHAEIIGSIDSYLDLPGDQFNRIQDIQLITSGYSQSVISELVAKKSKIDPWVNHIYRTLGNTGNAEQIAQLHSLFDDDPSIYLTSYFLGNAYCSKRKYFEAVHWYQSALDRNPSHGWSWLNMAKAMISANFPFADRLNALNKAEKHMTDSMCIGEVLRPLASHLSCTHAVRRAIDLFLQLSTIEPESDAILYAIENLIKIGDYENACELVDQVKTWSNTDVHIWAAEYVEWADMLRGFNTKQSPAPQ